MINQILFMKIDEICTKLGININEKVLKNREASIEAAPYLVCILY